MMHDRTFDRAAGRAKRLKVRHVNPAEMTAAQRARVDEAQNRCSLDDRLKRISQCYLEEMACQVRADSPWYGLRVGFGREIAVENVLREHRIESLVPMRKGREKRVRHRIIEAESEPAITGYVLVRFFLTAEACVGLMAVEHVISLVGVNGIPLPIGHDEVMRFKALADDGQLDWSHDRGVSFEVGEKVRLSDGPFGGFFATVIAVRGDRRGDAVVEADVFGRMVPVTVPLAILEKL